jgi:6-phosphofructokinase
MHLPRKVGKASLFCAVIDKCFGFDTAVEEAQRAIMAAKVEATSAYKGIGLVKLMGRQSGFITMQASMASGAPILQSCYHECDIFTARGCDEIEPSWDPQCGL